MYDGKRALVKKDVLPRKQRNGFQRVRVVNPVAGSEWHIQLPNGVSVHCPELPEFVFLNDI